ncbi:MAG: hypothetical protein HKO71_02475, partial [Pseudomonadales bacterium]|nr:hypothetical protein [Pseudomonadales bacterium]
VDVFLQLAKAALQPIPLAAWQQLLFSPYLFAGQQLPGGRNRLIQAMYHSGEQDFKLADLPRLLAWYAEKHAKQPLPKLVAQFDDLSLIAGMRAEPGSLLARLRSNKPALPSQWLEIFSDLLQQFNWPGERALNSDEFQQRQTFAESCAEFWQVDVLAAEVSASEALALLRQKLHDTIYHKQTQTLPGQAVVQVLGTLEASGQHFDQLWLCGMSERDWPPRPTINALLPFALQARLDMPGASEQREFDYAQRLTDSLIIASAQLQLSYVHLSDGVETSLAPIVHARLQAAGRELQCIAQTQVAADAQPCIATQPWETLPDFYGSEYPQLYDAQQRLVLRRGISLLKDYALNPFIAYARHRLEIEPLPRRESGLTALERGQVLHTVVETFWRNLQSSSALQSCPAGELEQLLTSSVGSALQQLNRRRFKPLGARLLELQQQVFTRLVQAWLQLERERPGFSVAALEQPLAVQLGGFYISGRIDRIDRLDSGEILLLDYKTGRVATTGWLDERISSPQLPLYWLALQQQLPDQSAVGLPDTAQTVLYEDASQCAPALAFACLKSGELGFKGLADEDTAAAAIDGIDSMRTAQREVFTTNRILQQHWLQALTQRCDEIASGLAVLDLDSPSVSSFGDDAYEPLTRARAALVGGLYEVVETPHSIVGEYDD